MIDLHESKPSKSVTVRMSEDLLEEIKSYGVSHSEFIREAVVKRLKELQKEELIKSYQLAVEETREESEAINDEVFVASSKSIK